MVFLAGILFCFVSVSAFCYLLLHFFPTNLQSSYDKLYYYVFCVFAFTAIVDLLIGMTLDGIIGTVDFYLHTGEPYLKSSYGSFINWWDGTFHWALYIYMTYLLSRFNGTLSDRLRLTGLVWVGSIMNSLVVFLPGNVAGKFGGELKWSYLLNVPYVLFPLMFAVRLFGQEGHHTTTPTKKSPQRKKSSLSPLTRIIDFIFIIGLIVSLLLAFLRLFAALRSPLPLSVWWRLQVEPYLLDPTLYPLLQTIIYVVYFVPYYIYAITYLVSPNTPPSQHFLDATCLHLGAALQAQFSFVGPSLHNIPTYPEPTWQPVPAEGWIWFVMAHTLLTILPILLWLRVVSAQKTKSE
jgi:hypothetical protein